MEANVLLLKTINELNKYSFFIPLSFSTALMPPK